MQFVPKPILLFEFKTSQFNRPMTRKLNLFFIAIFFFTFTSYSQLSSKQRVRASKIHKKIFTVDSHTDTPMNLLDKRFNLSTDNSSTIPRSCIDIPRMKSGGLDAAFFAVFLVQGALTDEGYTKSYNQSISIFDSIDANLKRYSHICNMATNPSEAIDNNKNKKTSIFIGVENGYPIGDNLDNIDYFYNRGARYITLCHSRNNQICTSSTDTSNLVGLSDFGIKVVERMNNLGMMIDVSHVSDQTFYDVINHSKSPVIASHSCAQALCDNPRNLSDGMLKALAKHGGVVQMCILSAYVKTPEPFPARDSAHAALRTKYNNFQNLSESEMENARRDWWLVEETFPPKLASIKDAVDHIDHMVNLIGINHVGIGTDFDGGGGLSDCKNAAQLENITLELYKRGYSRREIEKIWGKNLMRVMKSQKN